MIRLFLAIILFFASVPTAEALEPLSEPFPRFRIINERPLWNREPAHWLNFDGNGMHYTVHPSNMDPYKTTRSVGNGK